MFEYFSGNMDIDCDGSGIPEDYGYGHHSTRGDSTSVKYSNGKSLNSFETKFFVVHEKKHIGSKYGTMSGKRSPGIVWDTDNNKMVYAVAGDAGAKDETLIGEASAKVFREFGYSFYNPKNAGDDRWHAQGGEKGNKFRYILSISSRISSIPEKNSNKKINNEGNKLFRLLKKYGYEKAKALRN